MDSSNKPKPKRSQLYVDARFQGTLLLRVAGYWLLAALAVVLMLFGGRSLFSAANLSAAPASDARATYAPALLALLTLLPIVLMDVLKLTNRVVGPILRLRTALRALACGEKVDPVRFRDGDFWQEFADEFNTVAAQLNHLREVSPRQEAPEELSVG